MDRKRPPIKGKSYVVNFVFKGVPCREYLKIPVTLANDKIVFNLTAEIKSRIHRGDFIYADYFPNSKKLKSFNLFPSDQTLREASKEWLKLASKRYPESTYMTYQKDLYLALKDLGAYQIKDLVENHSILIDWYNEQTTTRKTVSNKFCPLRGVFDMLSAKSSGQIKNPVRLIDWNLFGSNLKENKGKEIVVYTPDEVEAILNVCNERERNYWEFAFFSGLRTGEQYGLRYSDNLTIQRTMIPRTGGKSKPPKTKAGKRTLVLHPRAKDAYERQKALTFLQGDVVFPDPKTGKEYDDYEHTADVLIRLCKLAKVTYKTQYNTRHTFASMMLTGGVDVNFISPQLGHSSPVITLTIYARWIPSKDDKNQYDVLEKGASEAQNY